MHRRNNNGTMSSSQGGNKRGDKFAAMAAGQQHDDKQRAREEEELAAKRAALDHDRLQRQKQKEIDLEQLMQQRSAVWKDLEEAEAATIRLLQLSQKTTQRLARSTTANIDNDDDANAKDELPLSLQECTEQFRETVS